MVLGELSLPWQGETLGDAGPYDSNTWREAWRQMFGGGLDPLAGVFAESGTRGLMALQVMPTTPNSRAVDVNPGAALLFGTFYRSPNVREITIPQNSAGNPRIDLIALRWHSTNQTVRLIHRQGTSAANPVPPSLAGADGLGAIRDIPLAEIRVNAGFTAINAGHITPLAIQLPSGSVRAGVFLNGTGATIEPGRAVELDPTRDQAIRLATQADRVVGISMGRIPNTEYGVVATSGLLLAYFAAGVVRGNNLLLSSTAGVLDDSSAPGLFNLGFSMETGTGAGYYLVYLDPQSKFVLPYVNVQVLEEATSAISGGTWTNIAHLAVDFTINTGRVRLDWDGSVLGSIRMLLNGAVVHTAGGDISTGGRHSSVRTVISRLFDDVPVSNQLRFEGARRAAHGESQSASLLTGTRISIQEV